MDKEPLIGGYRAPNVPPPPYAPNPPQAPPPVQQTYGAYSNQPPVVIEQGRTIAVTRQIVLIPPDYTYLAIIAVICFFPLGLVALSIARRSKESVLRGDIQSAYSEAISARLLSRLSISIGSLLISGIILAIVLPTTLNSN